jgi:cell shape-determining protein MreC
MLEGIGTVVKLKGDMLLESPEKRLAKSNEEIKRLKDQVQELKLELAANQAKFSQLHQLQEENAELKRKLEHYERDRSSSTDQVIPRKRIHLS